MREAGELVDVTGAERYEIGAITDLNAKNHGPALLFDDILGFRARAAVPLTAAADPRGAPRRSRYGPRGLGRTLDLVQQLRREAAAWARPRARFPPQLVEDGPVTDSSLSADAAGPGRAPLPAVARGQDGGRYIGTDCRLFHAAIRENSLDQRRHLPGMQLHDRKTLGLFARRATTARSTSQQYH